MVKMNTINTMKETGFTLIEFVVNFIIIGFIVIFFLHKYQTLAHEALQLAKYGATGAVKGAWATSVTSSEKMGKLEFPTLDELTQDIYGATAVSGQGIKLYFHAEEILINLYTGSQCHANQEGQCVGDCYPASNKDEVRCIGALTPQ